MLRMWEGCGSTVHLTKFATNDHRNMYLNSLFDLRIITILLCKCARNKNIILLTLLLTTFYKINPTTCNFSVHEDRPVRTGGGFTYFRRDFPVGANPRKNPLYWKLAHLLPYDKMMTGKFYSIYLYTFHCSCCLDPGFCLPSHKLFYSTYLSLLIVHGLTHFNVSGYPQTSGKLI